MEICGNACGRVRGGNDKFCVFVRACRGRYWFNKVCVCVCMHEGVGSRRGSVSTCSIKPQSSPAPPECVCVCVSCRVCARDSKDKTTRMAAVQTELCTWSQPWNQNLHVYQHRAYNPLMDGLWSDWTPLHEAALQGRLLLLRRLLSQGFSACVSTVNGVTALHEACAGGHYSCAKTLLEYGADASAVTLDGATPLFNACCSGSPALVSLILKHSTAHHPAHLLASPIHEAAKRGHITCLELLLAHGVNADLELAAGTPLYCACEAQRTDCVHTLLLLGADVNGGRGLDTPLHAAARVGGAREVELLLEHGADGNCRNSEGKRAVELTQEHSKERLILQSAGPCSLSQLCRLRIRRSLGRHRLNRTHTLYLPHTLCNYLLYR